MIEQMLFNKIDKELELQGRIGLPGLVRSSRPIDKKLLDAYRKGLLRARDTIRKLLLSAEDNNEF